MARYPSLEDNYTPIPTAFLREVFRDDLGHEELVIMLLFFHHTYGWKKERAFVQLSLIVEETHLSEEQARRGLEAALARGAIMSMPMGEDDPAFLLATTENERFLDLYGRPDEDDPLSAAPPRPAASPQASPRGEDPFAMPAPASFDMPSDEIEPVETRGSIADVGAEHGSIELDGETISVEVEPAYDGDPAPVPSSPAKAMAAPAVAAGELPFGRQTVDMLTRILGRLPGKDETARLVELGAEDEELVEAMSSLLSKTDNVYSSDLVVYEVESRRSQKRRLEKKNRSEEERAAQQARQKACRRCNGLGYIFIGVNEIRECSCRKDPSAAI